MKIDFLGFILVAVGLACLQVVLDKGIEDDWFASDFILTFGVISAISLTALVFWEMNHDDPIVDLPLLRNRNFASAMVVMFVTGFILISTTQMLPQFLQSVMGYTATDAGLALTAGGCATLVMMPVVGGLIRKIQPKYLIAFGLAVESLACLYLRGFNTEINFGHAALGRMFQGFGLPFLFVPITTVSYAGIPPGKSNNASALINTMRNLGGSFGISMAVGLLTRRGQYHHSRLGETFTVFTRLRAGSGSVVGGLRPHARASGRDAELHRCLYVPCDIGGLRGPSHAAASRGKAGGGPCKGVRHFSFCLRWPRAWRDARSGPTTTRPTPRFLANLARSPTSKRPRGNGVTVGSAADPDVLRQWWKVFHDPELDSLEDRALRNNRDLKVAISRVREARAERQVVAAGLIPEVDATAGYNRSLGSKNVVLPLSALGGGGSSQSAGTGRSGSALPIRPQDAAASAPVATVSSGVPSPQAAPPGGPASPFGEGGLPGVTTNLYQAGFDAVWEIDIFGGVRRAIEAADAQAEAAQEMMYGVRVTLMAEVAATYIQLRSSQQRIDIARRNLESQRQTWMIARDKFNAGLGNEAEAAQYLAQLRLSETTIPPLVAAERMSQHTLGFLLGVDQTTLSAELAPGPALPSLPDDVPVGVPSDVLRRRPDVRQAERQLAASTAQVGEATAQLYPQFSLTGSVGIDSSDLKHLPERSSRYYSIAPGVSWPILDWAKLHAAIGAANEEEAQALLGYQTSILQALKDVEDALVQYGQERERHTALTRAVEETRRARQVTAQIYTQGLADQTATLEAERAVFQAEDELAQSEASLRVGLVGLYKALGGGWDFKS